MNGNYRDFQQSWNRGRSFSLNITWRFGSLKASVKKAEHSIENDDVVALHLADAGAIAITDGAVAFNFANL